MNERSSIMANRDYTIIPHGKIHELQISDKEMYAFEPLLLDTIYDYKARIADLRKELGALLNGVSTEFGPYRAVSTFVCF